MEVLLKFSKFSGKKGAGNCHGSIMTKALALHKVCGLLLLRLQAMSLASL